jgi:purine-nucleoside phosphorylase
MKSNPYQATAGVIRKSTRLRPTLAIVLGSGFHGIAEKMRVETRLPYANLPGMPLTGVPGHLGELLVGTLGGAPVAILSGRAHYYEGYDLAEVTFAVRTLAAWGIKDLLLTNAAGGINRKFKPGDFMLLTDHVNFMGVNPLRGPVAPGQTRFVDMSNTYDASLAELLKKAARNAGLRLRSGVYLAVSGPSYETPAEIRAFARLGADAVGMSTVPEAIVARQCGLRVAGLSCITNMAAGVSKQELSHREVLETAEGAKEVAADLLCKFMELYIQTEEEEV